MDLSFASTPKSAPDLSCFRTSAACWAVAVTRMPTSGGVPGCWARTAGVDIAPQNINNHRSTAGLERTDTVTTLRPCMRSSNVKLTASTLDYRAEAALDQGTESVRWRLLKCQNRHT